MAIVSNERNEQTHHVLHGTPLLDADTFEEGRVFVGHRAGTVGTRDPDACEVVRDVHQGSADAVHSLRIDAFDERDKVGVAIEEAQPQVTCHPVHMVALFVEYTREQLMHVPPTTSLDEWCIGRDRKALDDEPL